MAVSSEWKEVQGDLSAQHGGDEWPVAVVTLAAVCHRLQSLCGSISSTNTERKWPLSDRKWSSSTTTCWMPKGPARLRTSPPHRQAQVRHAWCLGLEWWKLAQLIDLLLLPAPAPSMPGYAAQAPQQQSLLGYPPGVRPPMPTFPGRTLVM